MTHKLNCGIREPVLSQFRFVAIRYQTATSFDRWDALAKFKAQSLRPASQFAFVTQDDLLYFAKSRAHHPNHTYSGGAKWLENQNDYARLIAFGLFHRSELKSNATRRIRCNRREFE